jgi:hypothetical protein
MARSSQKRSAQPLAGSQARPGTPDPQGVGGRQPASPPGPRGGGYLSSCTTSNFRAPDPRIDELRAMGLPGSLVRVADAIGADAFLAMWRIFDAEPSFRTEKGDLEVRLRPYRSYLRYQRNRYIEELAARGCTPQQIREAVRLNLCEQIGLRHIYRLLSDK